MVKGKLTREGFAVEFETGTVAEFAAVIQSVTGPTKGKAGRPKGTKNGVDNTTSVKYFAGKKHKKGTQWTPRDLKIAADMVKDSQAKGIVLGVSSKVLAKIRQTGDNKHRTQGAVGMAIMEIKRHMAGRTAGVPRRVARILSEHGYGKSTKRDLIEA